MTEKAPLFNEEKVSALIVRWQRTGEAKFFAEIINESLPLIDSIALRHGFVNNGDSTLPEIRNEAVIKLRRVLPHFDPARGRAFTLLSLALSHFYVSRAVKLRNRDRRVAIIPPEIIEDKLSCEFYVSPELSAEFRQRLAGYTTRFTEPEELSVQRFLMTTFIETGTIASRPMVRAALGPLLSDARLRILVNYFRVRLRGLFDEDYAEDYAERFLPVAENPDWQKLIDAIGEENARFFTGNRFGGIKFPNRKALAHLQILFEYLNDPDVWWKLSPNDPRQEIIFNYKLALLENEQPETAYLFPP